MDLKIITLSNGKKVGNFSSPHSFEFTDGSILPAVTDKQAELLKVTFIEKEIISRPGNIELCDIVLSFKLSPVVIGHMAIWRHQFKVGNVDVVFIPLPMLTALKDMYCSRSEIIADPFRCIRIEDRINKLVSIDKQCI